jgi:uncharacterized protein YuzE
MGEEIRIWYDKEGNVIGFSILKVSSLEKQKPISIGLKKHVA